MLFNNLMTKLSVFLIRIYQKLISPILKRWIKCRFYPTCSEYAILSLQKYGLRIGLKKTYNRLKRCNRYNLDSCIDFP